MAENTRWNSRDMRSQIHWAFFVIHILLFGFTNLFFLLLNLTALHHIWFIYPLFFWGLLVWGHYHGTRFILSGKAEILWEKILKRLYNEGQ